MASLYWVVGSARENGTKAVRNVGTVDVFQSHDAGTTVERAGGEYAVLKGLFQPTIPFQKGPDVVLVAPV